MPAAGAFSWRVQAGKSLYIPVENQWSVHGRSIDTSGLARSKMPQCRGTELPYESAVLGSPA